jgi:hypothetical protein
LLTEKYKRRLLPEVQAILKTIPAFLSASRVKCILCFQRKRASEWTAFSVVLTAVCYGSSIVPFSFVLHPLD